MAQTARTSPVRTRWGGAVLSLALLLVPGGAGAQRALDEAPPSLPAPSLAPAPDSAIPLSLDGDGRRAEPDEFASAPPGDTGGAVGGGSVTGPEPGQDPELDPATFPHRAPDLRAGPILQRPSTSGAAILWTTVTPGPGELRVEAPDGSWRSWTTEPRLLARSETELDADVYLHEAEITDLAPDTEYPYAVFSSGGALAAGYRLRTLADRETLPARVIVFGDSGSGSPRQRELADVMVPRNADFVLHVGDMAYSRGEWESFEDNFFAIYADWIAEVPFYPAPGNHEYKTADAQPYLDAFSLPRNAWRPSDQERYYSFDRAGAHFVMLDSTPIAKEWFDGSGDDDMLDWLRADLAASDACWKIVVLHHPPWSSGQHGSDRRLQEQVVPLLEDGGVRLVLSGHDHHYERTVPLWRGVPVEEGAFGITYVIAGNGGAGLRQAGESTFTAEVDDSHTGYVELEVDAFEIRGAAMSLRGRALDTFTLRGCGP